MPVCHAPLPRSRVLHLDTLYTAFPFNVFFTCTWHTSVPSRPPESAWSVAYRDPVQVAGT
eukprot:714755-Rhodomonas_salina.2